MFSTFTFSNALLKAFNSSITKIAFVFTLLVLPLITNAQTISISSQQTTVVETGGAIITLVISIDGGGVNNTGADITGTISYAGSAIDGTDYVSVPSFTIPVGASSTTITLSVINDTFVEGTESVIATISNLNIGSVGNGSVTVNILDDDAGSLFISIGSPVDGAEPLSNISFTVFIEGGLVNTTGSPITGTLSYAGFATISSDYVPATSFSILSGTNSTTISIFVIDDALVECTETIIATISNPNIGSIGTANSTANITDDECSQVLISIGTPTDAVEGSSNISFVVSLDGESVNNTGAAISGDITLTGTATLGTDCLDVISFEILDGASFQTVVVAVLDDLFQEPTESVIATISNPSIGVISPLNVDTAYIYDNDSTVSVNEIDFSDVKLSVYPNPTQGIFSIEADQQIRGVEIYDLQGRMIQSWKTSAKKVNVNINEAVKGAYFITVLLNDGRSVIRKVLIE